MKKVQVKHLFKLAKSKGRYLAIEECAKRLRDKAGASYAKGDDREAKALRDAATYLDSVATTEKNKFEKLDNAWKAAYRRTS